MQFSAQSCAPPFPVVPAATSPDCLFVAQPISHVSATHEIMIVAPGKPIHLQVRTTTFFIVKIPRRLASKGVLISGATILIVELVSQFEDRARSNPVVESNGPALFVKTDRCVQLVEPIVSKYTLEVLDVIVVDMGRAIG